MLLIRNAHVYAPQDMGTQDILISEGKIVNLGKNLRVEGDLALEKINAEGKLVFPGYIDPHVHMIGGGGEAGPYSRTPEVTLSAIARAGVTTVIGVLGTDGTTRHLESLLAKTRALEKEGVTAYMLTGSYEFPPVSMTGSIRRDIVLIDKVLGAGEFAVSDHRSSLPSHEELLRVSSDVHIGSMLAGKAGVMQFHLGVGKKRLEPLFRIVEDSELPIRHFIPTHVNREEKLFDHAIEFAKKGGFIDITSGIRPQEGFATCIPPRKALGLLQKNGVGLDRVTMSSDGNGSMAVYDEKGNVQGLLVTTMDSLHEELRGAVLEEGVPIEQALLVSTETPAKAYGLWPHKGRVAVGADADLQILCKDLELEGVFAMGQPLVQGGKLVKKGTFE